MNKLISIYDAIQKVKDGDVIMIGGFLGVGAPELLIDALVESGKKDLTLICNDSGFIDKGPGKLVVTKQFKKIITSHIGLNQETQRQMNAGETEVALVPQHFDLDFDLAVREVVEMGGYCRGKEAGPSGDAEEMLLAYKKLTGEVAEVRDKLRDELRAALEGAAQ